MISSLSAFQAKLKVAAIYIYYWPVPNLWHIRIISSHNSITVELQRMASYVSNNWNTPPVSRPLKKYPADPARTPPV